jgi:hypothetical protein
MGGFVANPRTPPTVVTGQRSIDTTLQQRVMADVQDEILLYLPQAAPLTVLTGKFRNKRKATQYQYDWIEKDQMPREAIVSANITSGSATVVVQAGQGSRFAKYYTLLNVRTRERVWIQSVATDTLTITRGVGSTAQAMTAGDKLVFLAPAYEDGSGLGTLKSVAEARQYNYTQIVRTPFGFTGRQANTSLYGGKDPMTERQWQGVEHSRSIEKMMLFGTRHSFTGPNGKLVTLSGGLEYFISSNVFNMGGIKPTERSFVEMLEEALRWGRGGYLRGSGMKWGFFSSRLMTEIEFWAKDRIEYTTLDKQVGLSVGKYVTTHGTLMLVHDPILDEDHPDYGFIVDMNHARYVYHQNRDTRLLDNREAPDLDADEEEYFSDCGFELELEASHTMLKGLPV